MKKHQTTLAISVTVLVITIAFICLFFLRPRQNVVFIMLDTLRADHLGIYGYERDTSPNIDAFARESVWFSRMITSAPWTPPAVGSMFTGLYASAHGMMPPNGRGLARKSSAMLDHKNETLAELFKQNGYQTAGVTPNPWIKAEFGYNQGFDQYYYRERARAEEITRAAVKILDSFEKHKPFFLFVHYLDPHDPYDPPDEYKQMFQGDSAGDYPAEVLSEINLYDGEIRYLDTMLARLFDQLRTRKLWDRTLVVVVADHGEQFKEHGNQGHGFQLYDEELHVPLFIKAGLPAQKVDTLVSTVDLFATVLELAGIEVPKQAQGVSLFDEKKLLKRTGVLSEIDRKFNWKSFTGRDGLRIILDYGRSEELDNTSGPLVGGVFDSFRDSWGRNPLEDEQLTRELKLEFDLMYQNILDEKIETRPKKISQGTLEELKSLGYLK